MWESRHRDAATTELSAPELCRDPVRIVVLVDATGSMGDYCSSVGSTLQQLFAVLDVLFEGAAEVDIVAYEDYCDGDRVLRVCDGEAAGRAKLKSFAAALRAGGGGDCPEAVKTGLNRIAELLRERNKQDAGASGRTIVIHYTDAPPHHRSKVGSDKANLSEEIGALSGKEPGFDWVQICEAFQVLGARVVTFIPQKNCCSVTSKFFVLLGDVVVLPSSEPHMITRHTMGVILGIMGQLCAATPCEVFKDQPNLNDLHDEDSNAFCAFLAPAGAGETDLAPRAFAAHSAFCRDLSKLPQRFQESVSFQDVVFQALKDLFVPASVLAITYNSVLGLLWRLVCKRREDARVQPLCDALSACVLALQGEQQAQLRTWVDESYNQLEEIREIISTVVDPCAQGVLVLDASKADDLPTKEEVRSILHAPTPGVLRKVQGLLTRLIVVCTGDLPTYAAALGEEPAPMYVPMALGDREVFSLLAHVLLPGTLMSLRPAAMLAILAHLSGNATLQPRAKRFLESIRGSWIPPIEKAEDYPEVLNGEFVRLVVRAPEFLTETELKLYQHLGLILRVRRAGKLRIAPKVGYTPAKSELTPDVKSKTPCRKCGQCRSMTLMKEGTCCLCLYTGELLEDSFYRRDCPEPAEDKSHLVECRSCQALYAVVNIACLNVAPKCYYCREKQPCESVTCVMCENKFCAPSASSRIAGFVCAVCTTDSAKGLSEGDVLLGDFAELNPGTICSLGLAETARKHVFDRVGLYKLWMGHKDDLATVPPSRLETLTFAGKPVKNVVEMFDAIVERVLRGRLAETCNLCFEDRPIAMLQSACGSCKNFACNDCLGRWYGQLAPGRLYVPSEGLCAFCKRTPKAKTLRTFNRLACRLVGRKSLELRADMYYGWCTTCFQIAEAVPRQCAREAPQLVGFECEECKARRLNQSASSDGAIKKASRACPSCKTSTVKISGCNHITCPCGAHWCWQCGGEFGEDDIYDHMQSVHGSIGLDGDGGDFSDDDYDA